MVAYKICGRQPRQHLASDDDRHLIRTAIHASHNSSSTCGGATGNELQGNHDNRSGVEHCHTGGIRYVRGTLCPAARGDYATAFQIWRQAADQGNRDAQTLVGTMYANGRSIPQDYAEALKWHRKAADQGTLWPKPISGKCSPKAEG
ncbi:tetratricopeptide repeat protein [Bradyrhizobium sp. JYMT SZCCT0428]|uniref:tetratricopeptide repeat protein n=1 Tax=Bradyrhizobium sp. JYMT SZCCT0428 TaxID=2807673 RepID=UPI0039088A74